MKFRTTFLIKIDNNEEIGAGIELPTDVRVIMVTTV